MTDSSERKTIQINPDLFKVSGNTTRKNRAPRQSRNPIKVKAPPAPKNNSTLKKNLLKMIRNHQQQQQQQQKSSVSANKSPDPVLSTTHEDGTPKSEFEQSMQYLSKINEKTQQDKKKEKKLRKVKNQTIRNVIPIGSPKIAATPVNPTPKIEKPNVIAVMPPAVHLDNMPLPPQNEPPIQITPPIPYGCLKNGNLPTYRVWKNQTQKKLPFQSLPLPPKPLIDVQPSQNMQLYEEKLNEKIQDISKMEQAQILQKPVDKNVFKKPRKQRRILKRTFRVGKSKQFPKVSVLVSNKTIRNNTNLKTIDLKQTSIKDVKQYLLKQGLIKVGTTTPNDVLRQMYESAKLLPGEVKNYNPENLLYNYFNSDVDL